VNNPAYDLAFDPDAPNESRAISVRLVGCKKRVLEFGCSTGRVTAALAQRACRVTAIDVDADAAEHARRYADELVILDLDEADLQSAFAGRRWDVALFGDVLEHLRDPLHVLREARGLLEPDGCVVLSVPNVAHADVRIALLAGDFPYGASGLLDRTHLRFFTLDSLTTLLNEAGFLPVDIIRVVIPVFASELARPRDSVAAAVLETIMSDLEAESYQYVVRALPDTGDVVLRDLSASCTRLGTELHHTRMQYEHDLGDARTRQHRLELELAAIKNGTLMRLTGPLRRVYRSVRRRIDSRQPEPT